MSLVIALLNQVPFYERETKHYSKSILQLISVRWLFPIFYRTIESTDGFIANRYIIKGKRRLKSFILKQKRGWPKETTLAQGYESLSHLKRKKKAKSADLAERPEASQRISPCNSCACTLTTGQAEQQTFPSTLTH